jgi:hypothetical protein
VQPDGEGAAAGRGKLEWLAVEPVCQILDLKAHAEPVGQAAPADAPGQALHRESVERK